MGKLDAQKLSMRVLMLLMMMLGGRFLKLLKQLGYNKTTEVLGISKDALHNYLHGLRRAPDEVAEKIFAVFNRV
jgi:hypothetical protein